MATLYNPFAPSVDLASLVSPNRQEVGMSTSPNSLFPFNPALGAEIERLFSQLRFEDSRADDFQDNGVSKDLDDFDLLIRGHGQGYREPMIGGMMLHQPPPMSTNR